MYLLPVCLHSAVILLAAFDSLHRSTALAVAGQPLLPRFLPFGHRRRLQKEASVDAFEDGGRTKLSRLKAHGSDLLNSFSRLLNTGQSGSVLSGFTLTMEGVQRLAFSTVLATMLVAALQAGVALFQYRTNPQGQLAIPPGPTVGIEYPNNVNNCSSISWVHKQQGRIQTEKIKREKAMAMMPDVRTRNVAIESTALVESSNKQTMVALDDREDFDLTEPENASLLEEYIPSWFLFTDKNNTLSDRYGRVVKRMNRFLVLLLPLLVKKVYVLWLKCSHLMDIGIVLALVRVIDSVSRRVANFVLPDLLKNVKSKLLWNNLLGLASPYIEGLSPDTNGDVLHSQSLSQSPTSSLSGRGEISFSATPAKPLRRVLVLGDSLAVGIGCIDRFETRSPPEEGLEYWRIENTTAFSTQPVSNQDSATSPIFPRLLAAALASGQKHSVSWRSAGVDGGAVSHIREFLLPVLKEEVDAGRKPDCLVILCGMNDLKLQFADAAVKPWRIFSAYAFRRDLRLLFKDIATICCSSGHESTSSADKMLVVLPAMPVQMFLKNTVVSIFPLFLLLDMIVGYWESQKKRMADQYSSAHDCPVDIKYMPLSATVVNEWYDRDSQMTLEYNNETNTTSASLGLLSKGFVAADGIHPNAKCYAFWAEYVADSLLNKPLQEDDVICAP